MAASGWNWPPQHLDLSQPASKNVRGSFCSSCVELSAELWHRFIGDTTRADGCLPQALLFLGQWFKHHTALANKDCVSDLGSMGGRVESRLFNSSHWCWCCRCHMTRGRAVLGSVLKRFRQELRIQVGIFLLPSCRSGLCSRNHCLWGRDNTYSGYLLGLL